jgi:hypothetical protein
MTYAQRFTEALALELGDAFTVHDMGSGLVIADHGAARLVGFLPDADRRRPVPPSHVRLWIDTATARERSNLPHYTPAARAAALAMLEAVAA